MWLSLGLVNHDRRIHSDYYLNIWQSKEEQEKQVLHQSIASTFNSLSWQSNPSNNVNLHIVNLSEFLTTTFSLLCLISPHYVLFRSKLNTSNRVLCKIATQNTRQWRAEGGEGIKSRTREATTTSLRLLFDDGELWLGSIFIGKKWKKINKNQNSSPWKNSLQTRLFT